VKHFLSALLGVALSVAAIAALNRTETGKKILGGS
jgi:hypothetical protein